MIGQRIPHRLLSPADALKALRALMESGAPKWFLDMGSSTAVTLLAARGTTFSKRTPYQQLDIFEAEDLGLCMVLDGRIQLAQSDERIYHELLIHPACVFHGSPRRVAVLGGGDGCAVRELTKYREIEEIFLVDIDEEVVELFRDRFRTINGGALMDPRVTLACEDAMAFLQRQDRPFDLIISDLTEPFDPSELAGELSFHLYTQDFYALIQERLTPEGIFVCQTGGALYQPDHDRYHLELVQGIRASFPHVTTCYEFIPSFSELWSITLAARRPLEISWEEVDRELSRHGIENLWYYDGSAHERAFRPPKPLRFPRPGAKGPKKRPRR
jgi:spermidine synthase